MKKAKFPKNRISLFSALFSVLAIGGFLLFGNFGFRASATVLGFIPEQKRVSEFIGTSNGFVPEINETAALPKISFAADCPGEIDETRSFYAIHVGEEWKAVGKDSVFSAGEWRLELTVRVRSGAPNEGENAGYIIDSDYTVEIDGVRFETDGKIHNSGTIRSVRAFSPAVTLSDETCNHNFQEGYSTVSCAKPGKRYYTCTECGISKTEDVLPTGDHRYGIVSEENECYETCLNCGIIAEKAEHDYMILSAAGDCGNRTLLKRCIRCGKEKTETVSNAHVYSDGYVYDGEAHYRVCTVCFEKADAEPHTEGEICAVCGKNAAEDGTECIHGTIAGTEETPGAYYTWLSEVPETGDCESKVLAHLICLNCGQWFRNEENVSLAEIVAGNETPTLVEPEDMEDISGAHEYENDCAERCLTCGATRSVTHEYAEDWSFDGFMHFKECRLCGALTEAVPHTFTDWVVDKDGKCTGVTTRHISCEICNMELVSETLVKGHAFGQWTVKDATCTKEGYAEQTCAGCKAVRRYTLAPLGHVIVRHNDYTVDNITGEITPESYICEVCNALFADEEGTTLLSEGQPEETDSEPENAGEFPWRMVLWISLLAGGAVFVGFGVFLLISDRNREKREETRAPKL